MNRTFLTKLHLIVAAFMFPAVLMFLGTGALYTWGNTGEWTESSEEIALTQDFATLGETDLRDLAATALAARGADLPSGRTKLAGEGAEQSLNWSCARTEVAISAGASERTAQVEIKEASLHRWLVQLHKAKGSVWFKIYASALALVLLILVASGVILGLQIKALRRMTIVSSAAGLAAFVGFVLAG